MNIMKLNIRAYTSKIQGSRGRETPIYTSNTDDWKTATLVARQLAKEYGTCVVEDTNSGQRVWVEAYEVIMAERVEEELRKRNLS